MTRACKRIKYTRETRDIAAGFRINDDLAALLYSRGLREYEEIKSFLEPDIGELTSPFEYTGVKEAIDRIKSAREKSERVLVFGDYDCDGVGAVAILWQVLLKIGIDAHYYIPTRSDGYGLTDVAVSNIVETESPDLIITLDCGISSKDIISDIISRYGIDVIVTDHHELPDELPQCVVVNPKLDRGRLFSDYCGAGVAYLLARALIGNIDACEYIDIAAISTIGDIVPLLGDNRIIVSEGIKRMNKAPRRGIGLLLENLSLKGKVTSTDIAFKIVPRINSFGRIGDASRALVLFTSRDHFTLECVIREMNDENKKRQDLCLEVENSCIDKLRYCDFNQTYFLVMYDEGWNEGVVGIAASKLVEKYHRPCLLLTRTEDGSLKGSGRCIEGINLFDVLNNFREYFITFGGHSQAAGLKIKEENLLNFVDDVNQYVMYHYKDVIDYETKYYDIDIFDQNIDFHYIKQIESLEPYGCSNPKPLFSSTDNLVFTSTKKPEHIKAEKNEVSYMAFFKGDEIELLNDNNPKRYYYTLSINNFNGREYAQAILEDYDLTNLEHIDCQSCFEGDISAYSLNIDVDPEILDDDEMEEYIDSIDPNGYGIVFVAFSKHTYHAFLNKHLGFKTFYQKKDTVLPVNCIYLAPNYDDLRVYDTVIYLDRPYFVSAIGSNYFSEEVTIVLRKNAVASDYELSDDYNVFADVFRKIKDALPILRPLDLRKICSEDEYMQVYYSFKVFCELGIIGYDDKLNKYVLTGKRAKLDESIMFMQISLNKQIRV